MESKKIVAGFVRPNWILMVILMLIPIVGFFAFVAFLCGTLPTLLRANKSLKNLEESSDMDKAAKELTSADSKKIMNGKLILTENYVFCKGTGYIFTYDEILWAYRHRQTNTILFIPIQVIDSLYIAAKGMKPKMVASMGKDKLDEIKAAILEIYNHNQNCLIGYTNESVAKYKSLPNK